MTSKLAAWLHTATVRYAAYGALFGLFFPIVATALDIYLRGQPLNFETIVQVQRLQPLHWVIDTAPLVLGVFASLAGIRQDRFAQIAERLEQTVAERTAALWQANASLQVEIGVREQTETELRRQKQYLEAIVQNSPLAIVTLDLDHRVIAFNPAFESLYGYSLDEAAGRLIDDLLSTDAIRDELVSYSNRVTGGETVHGTGRRRRKDGSLVDVEIFGVPVKVAGEQIGILALYHDISDRRRAEEALVAAKDAAEAANRAKSEFLANMSHEIRTPMNAIIGMTGLLLDTHLTDDQCDFVETIRGSGDALLTIINDILDFSKIESGRLVLEQQPFDLYRCIEDSLDLVATRAAEKQLDLAYLIDDHVPGTLIGDVTRLRQIMVNLLSNAVKFTEAGEVVVSVTSRALDLKYHELQFAVRDTGIGIPPDRMHRLFRSFSQVDASTTRKYGGTGLGLAISKRLSELMGGAMWAESNGLPGQGAVFYFTLIAEALPGKRRMYLRGAHPQLGGKRLLIVDDNATNRQILVHQAESWGMLPRAAMSGAQAIDWLRRGSAFDIAILDMQMPDRDGVSLAAEIRKSHNAQTLPIVMLTSLGHRDGDTSLFAACLTKPIKPSQLYDTLITVFDGRPTKTRHTADRASIDSEMAARHPLRMLLAEDNGVNQKVALRILERMGYRADVAANGLEVLESLLHREYDVVLMDVQMPEMDGLEATRLIRQQWPKTHQPHIIAMTANAMQGDREQCLEAGMDDYVSKPVKIEELASALGRIDGRGSLGGSPLMRPLPPATSRDDPAAIDSNVLNALREAAGVDAPKVLDELVCAYLDDATRLLAELSNAMQSGDALGLKMAAHTLKSTSASLGAMSLARLAAELEEMGRAGSMIGAASKTAQAACEYERVVQALREAATPAAV
jgi:PAS domain S-box-containing protein